MYLVHKFIKEVFGYPRAKIGAVEREGEYWAARRPAGLSALSDWQKDRVDIVAPYLKRNPGTLGDIGSGDGAVLRYLKEHNLMKSGTGYDSDQQSLAQVRASGMSAVSINLWNEEEYAHIAPADWYIAFEVFEHLPRPEVLLKFLVEKSTHGIFFSAPNTGYLTYRLRLLFGKMPAQWAVHPGEHLRFWTLTDMRWWLKALGYERATVYSYRGIPILNHLWPALFAAGTVVHIPK